MDMQTEIETLCKQIQEGSNADAVAAIEILRIRGWLQDRSLESPSIDSGKLSGVNLSGARLAGANLSGADLSNANLSGADFFRADLVGANLTEANLSKAFFLAADLFGARLNNANLNEVDFSESNLSRSDLSGAKLTGATLIGANLSGAELQATVLSNARCDYTVFSDIDLSSAIDLETIRHDGPSTISIGTIYNSKGKIPKEFLRGCGVPEIMIEYLPYMMTEAIQFYSCFISYSHADKEFAHRLHDTLQERGIRCWLDEKQLKPGHDVHEEIARGIRHWDKLILCCSEAAISSWWVHNEIEFAFQKEAELTRERGHKVRALIPLDLDGHIFKDASAKVVQLRANRFVGNFQGWQDQGKFNHQVEGVIAALRTDEGRGVLPPSRL